MSLTLSPCDSCLTLSNNAPEYNNKLVMNYVNRRLSQYSKVTPFRSRSRSATTIEESITQQPSIIDATNRELELVMIHDHHDINIKLTAIHNLIDTHNNSVSMSDLTVNHLLIFLYYNQLTLSFPQFYINQLEVIHLGKVYTFNMNSDSSRLVDININAFNKFLVIIKPDNADGIYKFFEMETFLKQDQKFVDKSTGEVTYIDSIVKKIKGRSDIDIDNTNQRIQKKRIRKSILKILKRLYT